MVNRLAGLAVVVALLVGCGEPPDENGAVSASQPSSAPQLAPEDGHMVESQATLPREPANEFADIATTAGDAQTVWQRFNLTGRPPQVDFDTASLLFVGFGESGSCPARFDGLSVEGDRMHVAIGTEGGPDCTSDYNPRTFVLEVARDVLPDGGFGLTARGRTFVLSSESLSEPPPDDHAIVERLTSDSPQLDFNFDAQPRSVPRGGSIDLVLENEGDVSASTGSWNMVLYRWDDQRWLPADGDQGWEEPVSNIEEVVATVEHGDQQVIAHIDSEALDPGRYGVYAKLQLGDRGGAVELYETFEVAAHPGRPTDLVADANCRAGEPFTVVVFHPLGGDLEPSEVTATVDGRSHELRATTQEGLPAACFNYDTESVLTLTAAGYEESTVELAAGAPLWVVVGLGTTDITSDEYRTAPEFG